MSWQEPVVLYLREAQSNNRALNPNYPKIICSPSHPGILYILKASITYWKYCTHMTNLKKALEIWCCIGPRRVIWVKSVRHFSRSQESHLWMRNPRLECIGEKWTKLKLILDLWSLIILIKLEIMQQLVVQRVSSRIFEKNFMISFDIKGIKILQKIHRDFFLATMFKDDAAWCQWYWQELFCNICKQHLSQVNHDVLILWGLLP